MRVAKYLIARISVLGFCGTALRGKSFVSASPFVLPRSRYPNGFHFRNTPKSEKEGNGSSSITVPGFPGKAFHAGASSSPIVNGDPRMNRVPASDHRSSDLPGLLDAGALEDLLAVRWACLDAGGAGSKC
jgi:hypothetical protein